ncbi:MAG: SRPBCC family protein [Acidimicrobiales bacterium]
MMRNVQVGRTVDAPRASVWAVLADYPNIADWNDGVQKSFAIGDATEGVGAQRQCELAPNGSMQMRETIDEWVPEERMVVDIDQIEKMPVKAATMTFTLSGDGETTSFAMNYDYEPKGGPLAFIFGPLLDRQMKKGFSGFIDSLEPAAKAQAAS